jgi:ElaB/YqjD/DUF883 family membrane-anchored ribosome-binding protein
MMAEQEAIVHDIRHTRARIEQDVSELRYRFSPEGLVDQTQDKLKDVQEVVMDAIQENSQIISEKAQELGRNVFESVAHNPLPTTLMGVGVGLVIAGSIMAGRSSGHDSHYDPEYYATDGFRYSNDRSNGDSFKDTLSEKASEVGNRASEIGHEVSHQARRAKSSVGRWLENEPLLFGAAAVVAGAALGLLAPSSHVEDEVMGRRRDELVNQAKTKVHEVKAAATEAASEVKTTLQREGAKQGEKVLHAVEDAVSKTAHATEDTIEDSATKVKNAATK